MAIAIKQIPVLKGKVAKSFTHKATKNLEKRHSVDFSEQAANAKKILEKAKL
ncbi:hypothetical protein [uncultured Croceitalea sp.]|uniref:hypothetical protein n=1 Tax=uncultured Croceitalea sp. TaxID=1798908 RepID=UPI0033057FC8